MERTTDVQAAEFYRQVMASPGRPERPWTGPTIHYLEVPIRDDSPYAAEWSVFRRELPRLLAEGQEGRQVLIHGGRVVGVWDTVGQAVRRGRELFPGEALCVLLISEQQPVYHVGFCRPCHS